MSSIKSSVNTAIVKDVHMQKQEDSGDEQVPNKTTKKKKRQRKSEAQHKLLEAHYKKSKKWDKNKMAELQQLTGLKPSQIYKWKWDM
jgi:hypothetical protein